MAGVEAVRAQPGSTARTASAAEPFTKFAIDSAAQRTGRPIVILQAGCLTAAEDLDLAAMHAAGHETIVWQIDADDRAVRGAVEARPELRAATIGDLRSVPISPRSFDIVQCSLLLHRITHAELVLDRLVGAMRPGGLLLLRTPDRDTTAAFLDRRLPGFVRAMRWRAAWPGRPGPFSPRYEQIASVRGIEAFAGRHGLSVAYRRSVRTAARHGRQASAPAVHRLVSWLSRGRLASDHDELHYVIRKPEDRSARVLP
jgi:SAM-dependent methyltransferase